jgi:hypothetical protein
MHKPYLYLGKDYENLRNFLRAAIGYGAPVNLKFLFTLRSNAGKAKFLTTDYADDTDFLVQPSQTNRAIRGHSALRL